MTSLRHYTTLRAGGPAERLERARSTDQLAELAGAEHRAGRPLTVLGWGSNVLPSDAGVPGLVLINETSGLRFLGGGLVEADSGVGFQDLCVATLQRRHRGLEFAVGIPGTLGGALVSNAGAYRSNVSEFVTEIEVVQNGVRGWHTPEFMGFRYRDSVLRSVAPPPIVLLRVRMKLPLGEPKPGWDEAREYQRQRIGKQPPPASAGSFFKNVESRDLAQQLPTLPERLKAAGVVPAGYLIEQAGLRGCRYGGAQIAPRHANFMLNTGSATATEIRRLAEHVKARVFDQFGVTLEEEVLYLGDWSGWTAQG